MKTKKMSMRKSIPATGSFVSIPEAFPGAGPGFKHALKIEFQTIRSPKSKSLFQLQHVLLPHRILVDLQAIDPNALDTKRLMRDCEILKSVAQKRPQKLKEVLGAFGEDAPHSRLNKAAATLKELGLTEGTISDNGGGFVFLLVVLAACAMAAGCDSCNQAGKNIQKGIDKKMQKDAGQ